MSRAVWIILSAAFALGVWQAIVSLTGVPHFILPSPAKVWGTLIGSRELIGEHALITMTEVVLGPFWVWLVLGETAGFWTLLGGAILLAAIAGNAVSGMRRKPPPIGAV